MTTAEVRCNPQCAKSKKKKKKKKKTHVAFGFPEKNRKATSPVVMVTATRVGWGGGCKSRDIPRGCPWFFRCNRGFARSGWFSRCQCAPKSQCSLATQVLPKKGNIFSGCCHGDKWQKFPFLALFFGALFSKKKYLFFGIQYGHWLPAPGNKVAMETGDGAQEWGAKQLQHHISIYLFFWPKK